MTDFDNRERGHAALSRRGALTLATGVAALGVALGMRSSAFAQGKAEGKGEGKLDAKGEGKGDGKAEGKLEGKGEGKFEGKEGRFDGKAGAIRVDIASDGSAAVDVRCADGEPMRECADITKEFLDRIKAGK